MTDQISNKTNDHIFLKEILAKRTNTSADDWYLTFRSRDALQVITGVIKNHRGPCKISLQPFTCSTVAGSIINGGSSPLYSDISINDLSTDLEKLQLTQEPSLGAVIVQHTYGLIDPAQNSLISDKLKKRDFLLIEDSAHCAGRMAKDEHGDPIFDISMHSFGVEKILSSQFGGAVWINPEIADKELRSSLCEALSALPVCDDAVDRSTKTYILHLRILNHLPAFLKKPLKSRWMNTGHFIPAISDTELNGGVFLPPSKPGEQTVRLCIDAIKDIDINEQRRTRAVEIYSSQLYDNENYQIPSKAYSCNQPLLWFPILAKDRKQADIIKAAVTEAGYYSSEWGRPLLFPGVKNKAAYQSEDIENTCRVAQFCSERIVLLPTNVDENDATRLSSIINDLQGGISADQTSH